MDFFLAFSLIFQAVLATVFPTGSETSETKLLKYLHAKMCCSACFDIITLALVLQDVATPLFVLILAVICMLLIVIVYFVDKEALFLDIPDMCVSWAFVIVGAAFFFVGGYTEYWVVHSLWHICIFVGLALLIEAHNHAWNIINCVTCGKFCKPLVTMPVSDLKSES
jgi:hypothetical protein